MSLSYYIYYRVVQPERAEPVVHGIQSALFARCGVRGRLLKKRSEPDLWMEVYERIDDPPVFESELARAVEATGFAGLLISGSARRIECFIESCA